MKSNQLKAGAVLSYVSMGLSSIVSIVFTPIMLRLLGQSEYGLYNLVSSVVSYLGLLSFGFGSAYIRYYSRYKIRDDEEGIAKLNGMFITIFTVIGIVAALAGTILVLNVDLIFGDNLTTRELATSETLMVIMVINLSISFPASVFNSYITANEEYVFQRVLQIVKTLVGPFVMLPLLLMGYGSVGLVISTTILNLFVEFANVIYCVKKLQMKFSFKKFDFDLMKDVTVFSSYIFINMIIDQINWNVDKYIIGRFRGTVAVAVYGIAAQLNNYYRSFSTSISNVFVPRVNMMVASSEDNRELNILFTKIGRIQFMVLALICSGFIFFGRPFINMWAGKDYDGSYPIALILMIPVTISLIQTIGIEIQRAKNMHKFRSWLYLFIAIGNVALSIPLTKTFGGVGAAIGTSISMIIGNGFIMNWYYHNKVGLDIKYFWKQILMFLPAFIAPTLTGILIVNLINLYHPIPLLISGIIYVIVFVISMWFLGINQYEKDLIKKPILKIMNKL